ncbi:hypothetical protein [Microbulbifer epialgicus]|uniref:DUF5666 domain-containing protein n=1 Tax=Microbulbifer epialgicus TaxID=393907 RepID=A0ABV4P537_9GAMM
MLRVLTLLAGMTLTFFVQAEEVVTGTLEEIISEDFETGKVERRFSLKDEQSGHYYFIEVEELKRKGMKSGDRVKIRGERGKKHILHIRETEKLEIRDEE